MLYLLIYKSQRFRIQAIIKCSLLIINYLHVYAKNIDPPAYSHSTFGL